MRNLLSREKLQQLLNSNTRPTLIEALPAGYYEAGHLPGAVNIPHDEILSTAAAMIPDKEQVVVVYCANSACQNSVMAAAALRQLGYNQVYEYPEGKKDWSDAGLPLEKAGGVK